jgi:hypothetical protein
VHSSLLHHLRRNAVAYLALFVALGGTSFAAATVITGKNVKNGSLTGKDVKNSSLTGGDVKNKSLAPADFNGSVQGPQGDTGPQGPKGDTGAAGAPGTARAYAYVDKAGDIDLARSTGFPAGNVHVGDPDSGLYCLSGLSFTPHNAIATLGIEGTGIGVASEVGAKFGCPDGTQITVTTFTEAVYVDDAFSLIVN